MIASGDALGAEAVFLLDLEQYPHNGWSMFGLMQSLRVQGKDVRADEVQMHSEKAWQFADVELTAAVF